MFERIRTARRTSHDAGFMLIEAVIAIALIAVCAGAVVSAVLSVQHRTLFAQPSAALMLSAQNVLTDLRAATAYDGAELAALGGRSAAFDSSEPGPNGSPEPIHIQLSMSVPAPSGAVVAVVSVTDAQGRSASVQSTLTREAPAPGSTVEALAPSIQSAAVGAGGVSPSASESPQPAPQGGSCLAQIGDCRRAHGPIAL